MDHREALNFVIKHFKIVARELSEKAGIDPHQLSRFRNGHVDFVSTTLFKVVNALEPEQRAVFYGLLQGTNQGKAAA